MSRPLWCDDFDADLLKVVPGAADALGVWADLRMWTYCSDTGLGTINCPASWEGVVECDPEDVTDPYDSGRHGAFFWTDDANRPPAMYHTGKRPVMECTWLEVVRDEWVHGVAVIVNGELVWRPPNRIMERLMRDVRGYTVLDDGERETLRETVRSALVAATARLVEIVR